MAKSKKALIQELASKHNLPLKTVSNIVEHQFKYVAKIMGQGNFETVRLPYFGKFSVKPGRLKNVNKKKDATTNNNR
jgi:nucleoid DNA-binding protein